MKPDENLELRPGQWVEVRGPGEILATLDERGALDGLLFMPEMLAHCSRRYQVFKRADKTCDTITWTGLRQMERTVHLKMLRCDGSAHGGCQADCLLFWKEAWLRRAAAPDSSPQPTDGGINGAVVGLAQQAAPATANGALNGVHGTLAEPTRDRAWLESTAGRMDSGGQPVWRCQATELNAATRPLPWWEPKQYVRDVLTNDVSILAAVRSVLIAAYSKLRWLLTGKTFPSVAGSLRRTPSENLNLQSGDWVIVKSKEEILATLDRNGKNRGLTFDVEMIPYCGRRMRVLRRVERLIEESTGRMLKPTQLSVVLENAICLSRFRRPCPRSIYPFWREIWLRRAEGEDVPSKPCAANVEVAPLTQSEPSASP